MDLLELTKVAADEHMSKRKANLLLSLGNAERLGDDGFLTPNLPANGTDDEIIEAAGRHGGLLNGALGGAVGVGYGAIGGAGLAYARGNNLHGYASPLSVAIGAGLGGLAGGASLGGLSYFAGKYEGKENARAGLRVMDEIQNRKLAAEELMEDGLGKIAMAIGIYNSVSSDESLDSEVFGENMDEVE